MGAAGLEGEGCAVGGGKEEGVMFLTVPRCHGVCGFNPCLVEQRAWRFPACMGLG